MNKMTDEVIIASSSEGIGIEIWRNKELVIEIIRNDLKKLRTITLYKRDLPLDLIEESIQMFKKEIPNNYQD
jgi:hypothetical protein